MMRKLTPIEKAINYIEKAKRVLEEKGEYDSEVEGYGSRKAVRAAGRLLWKAVEDLTNTIFNVKNEQCPEPQLKDYEKAIEKKAPGLSYLITDCHDCILYLMVDLGTQSKELCDICFDSANKLIRIFSKLLPKQPTTTLPAQRAKLLTQRPTRRAAKPTLQPNP